MNFFKAVGEVHIWNACKDQMMAGVLNKFKSSWPKDTNSVSVVDNSSVA